MKISVLMTVLSSVSLTALAQLALKLASGRYAPAPPDSGLLTGLLAQFLHPLALAAILAYAGSLVLWLIALRDVPLSVAYPFAGVTIALVALLGAVVPGESLSWSQLGGIGLIAAGVLLLARF